jgi:BlaI family transcriptional regulator, penicillinase repressor
MRSDPNGGGMAQGDQLSRRERQIMDILHRRGSATIEEVRAELRADLTAAGVRAALLRLEQKGEVRKRAQGRRNVFAPRVSRERAKRSALRHLVETFFEGSRRQTVAAILELERDSLTREDLEALDDLIERALRERKGRGQP